MKKNKFDYYDGGYDYYISHKIEPVTTPVIKKETSASSTSFYKSKEQRAEEAKKRTRISNLEKEIEQLEEKKNEIEDLMKSPEIMNDYQELNKLCSELQEIDTKINASYEEWDTLN